jgi:shikimate dehydrogenase
LRLFGLIGFPLGHSRSAEYFNSRFARDRITDARYELFPMRGLQELPTLLSDHPELTGLNVTIPFKEKIIPLLTGIDPAAREIGSVNVVLIKRKGTETGLTGFNTDAEGFLSSLPDIASHRQALVLGTGGAARSVAWALAKAGVRMLFVSRTPNGPNQIGYHALEEFPEIIREHTLIVNTTPVGMYPHTNICPRIPFVNIGKEHFLYDLVYNPSQTLFLKKGAGNGARTQSGEEMFLKQAELSYSLFLG